MPHGYDDFLLLMDPCAYVYLHGNLNHQFRHYLLLVVSEHLFAVKSFRFLDFVQVISNDPHIDPQQYPILLGLGTHDLGTETTKPLR